MLKWGVAAIVGVGVVASFLWPAPNPVSADDTEFTLRNGTVQIPSDTPGVAWAFGDTPCGYGLIVNLPGGTVVCFDENRTTVSVSQRNEADEALVGQLLRSAPAYRPATSVPSVTAPMPPATGSSLAMEESQPPWVAVAVVVPSLVVILILFLATKPKPTVRDAKLSSEGASGRSMVAGGVFGEPKFTSRLRIVAWVRLPWPPESEMPRGSKQPVVRIPSAPFEAPGAADWIGQEQRRDRGRAFIGPAHGRNYISEIMASTGFSDRLKLTVAASRMPDAPSVENYERRRSRQSPDD